MNKAFTVYYLQFTVRLPLTVNSEQITDNIWKIANGEQITEAQYE